jgi:tetratricopeptide (TPR) repeat protein
MEAFDAYPFDLPKALESLEYAMSYDDSCPHAYYLMGRIHADQLQEYNKAIFYYQEALQRDVLSIMVYPHFINALMNSEQFEAAHKAINFALTIKGTDKGRVLLLKAICFEYELKFKDALNALKESEQYSFNSSFKQVLKDVRSRIQEKKSPKESKKKRKRKKKKRKQK